MWECVACYEPKVGNSSLENTLAARIMNSIRLMLWILPLQEIAAQIRAGTVKGN